ncbi:hypothetical protein H9P43_001317 [Blastocladiella emersonii ATCC 22665]|nr:hypothetical protein H9P43_001317 [Blastocladiella emersonii ATCC 22665]
MSNIFQSLTAQAAAGAAAKKRYLVEFRAGKMSRTTGNTVAPDTRKGLVFMEIGEDTLLHFYWKDRTTNRIEDDLIIFPDEAEFVRVTQSNDRVYMLAFKSSSQKLFFWMQEPKADRDAEFAATINRVINDPSSAAGDSPTSPNNEQAQLMQLLQQSMPIGANPARSASPTRAAPAAATATSPAPAGGATSEQMAQLRNLLAGIQVPQSEPDVDLTAVLNIENLRPVLGDASARAALFPHLPENAPHTTGELEETIRSPQFRQSLQTLAYALRSGQLATILTSMGLDPSSAGTASGVEALLRAVAASRGQPKQDDEDRMDTDS